MSGMRVFGRVLIWFFLVCGGVLLLLRLCLPGVHVFLETERVPDRSVDAIVVLSGGSGARVKRAVSLGSQRQIKTVFLTGSPRFLTSEPRLMQAYMESIGGGFDQVILEEQSLSTADHVRYLMPLFQAHQVRSICIVTSKYHTARSYRVFKRGLQEGLPEMAIFIVGADDGVDYSRWWTDSEMTQTVGMELLKQVYYLGRDVLK